MKFLKKNKLAVLSVAVFVLVAIFLAIPGQFVHFAPKGEDVFTYNLSGYQFFFNTVTKLGTTNPLGHVIGAGVTIIVLAVVSIALICFATKSSFFVLLASIVNLVIAILFFCMENAAKGYGFPITDKKFCGWPTYLCGALVILLALYLGYKAVMMMKDEIKHPSKPQGPSYNYLKK